MHEMALMKDLMKKIEDVVVRERAQRVVRISVWLGAFSHLSPDHFLEHFREDAKGTVAEGADVKIEVSEDRVDPRARDVVLKSVEVAEE